MFPLAVDEKKILNIVKTSTNCNDINMTLVKKVIDGISHTPTTYSSKLVHFQTK